MLNVDGEQDPQIPMQEVILGAIPLNFFRNLSYAANLVGSTSTWGFQTSL